MVSRFFRVKNIKHTPRKTRNVVEPEAQQTKQVQEPEVAPNSEAQTHNSEQNCVWRCKGKF